MSNQISRGQLLSAKYLGAFFTLMVPLAISILMNLLIIYRSGNIPFDSADWLRILGHGRAFCVAHRYIYLSGIVLLKSRIKRHHQFGVAFDHLGTFSV